MSIVFDVFVWLLFDTAVGFIFYFTGCMILKLVTFGQYQADYRNFTEFKARTAKSANFTMALGFAFYVALLFMVAYFN